MPLKTFGGFNQNFSKLRSETGGGSYTTPIDTFDDQNLVPYSGDTGGYNFDNTVKAAGDASSYSITATDSGGASQRIVSHPDNTGTGPLTRTVEDFEDNTLTDFDVAESPWTIDSVSPLSGSYSAHHPSGQSNGELIDVSDRSPSLQPGDTVSWDWLESDGFHNIVWFQGMGTTSTSGGHYELEVHFGNDLVSFQRDNGDGTETELHNEAWAHTPGDRYRTTIADDGDVATNPTFTVTIENVTQGTTPVSFTVQDTNGDARTGGGFGWFVGTDADVRIDDLTVERETSTLLSNYPKPGDTFRAAARFNADVAGGPRIWFGVQSATIDSTTERYQIHLKPSTDSVYLEKRQGGSWTQLGPSTGQVVSGGLNPDTWYDVEVRWEFSGRIVVNIFEFGAGGSLATVEGTDSTIGAGGFGLETNGNGSAQTAWYDDARITATENATDTVVVDSFEDGDLAEYDLSDAPFSASQTANIATNAGLSSNWGLSIDSPTATTGGNLIASSGSLTTDISPGDTISFFYEQRQGTPDGNTDTRLMWGHQDPSQPFQNYYGLAIDPFANALRLTVDNANTVTNLETVTWTPAVNTTYEFTIDWQTDSTGSPTGYFEIDCFDSAGTRADETVFPFTNSTADTTFSGGGCGIYANTTSIGAIDHIRVNRSEDVVTLENFEATDITSAGYVGDTLDFTLTTTSPIEGSKSLRSDVGGSSIINTGISTPRGYEYLFKMEFSATGSYPRIGFCDQAADGTTITDNSYLVYAGPNWDDVAIQERSAGSVVQKTTKGFDFSTGTTYWFGFSITDSKIWATVYDANGTQLLQTPSLNTTAYSGGSLSFEAGPTTTDLWDHVQRRGIQGPAPPTSTGTDDTIEGFERVDPLAVYSIDGSRAVEDHFSEELTLTDEGSKSIVRDANAAGGEWAYILRNDPPVSIERGNNYRYSLRVSSTDSDLSHPSALFLSNFNADGYVNGYKVQLNADQTSGNGYISIRKLTGTTTETTETELGQTLLSSALPLDEWVDVQIELAASGTDTIIARVFDSAGTELGSVTVTDATYNGPSYGVGSFRSGTYFDDIRLYSGSGGGGGGGTEPIADVTDTYYAATESDVQTQIDAAASGGGGVILLQNTTTYSPSSLWVLKPNVAIDFNGATVNLTGSQDFLLMANNSYIRNAKITCGSSYSGKVFLFDTAHAQWPSAEPREYSTTDHMYVEASYYNGTETSTETLFYFHQNGADQFITNVGIDINTRHAGYTVQMHSENSSGFINSNEVHGVVSGPIKYVDMWGPGEIKDNRFLTFYQPDDGVSDGVWRIRSTASQADANIMNGPLWDFGGRTGGPMILANNGSYNYAVTTLDYMGHGSNEEVITESGNAHDNYGVARGDAHLYDNGDLGRQDGTTHENIGNDGVTGDVILQNHWDIRTAAKSATTAAGSTFIDPILDKDSTPTPKFLPAPGNVQSAITNCSNGGGGIVRLQPNTIYDPSSRWYLAPNVKVDFNGAKVDLTTDHDIFIHDYKTVVKRADIDTRNVSGGFTSRAFAVDLSHPAVTQTNMPHHQYCAVESGFFQGTQGNGIVLDYNADPGYMGGHRAMIDADGGGTYFRDYSSERWCNSIMAFGNVSNFDTYLHHRGPNTNQGHHINVDVTGTGGTFWKTTRPATTGGAMNLAFAEGDIDPNGFDFLSDFEDGDEYNICGTTSTAGPIDLPGGAGSHFHGVQNKPLYTTHSFLGPSHLWNDVN